MKSECTRSFAVSKNIRGLLLLDESIVDKVRELFAPCKEFKS